MSSNYLYDPRPTTIHSDIQKVKMVVEQGLDHNLPADLYTQDYDAYFDWCVVNWADYVHYLRPALLTLWLPIYREYYMPDSSKLWSLPQFATFISPLARDICQYAHMINPTYEYEQVTLKHAQHIHSAWWVFSDAQFVAGPGKEHITGWVMATGKDEFFDFFVETTFPDTKNEGVSIRMNVPALREYVAKRTSKVKGGIPLLP